MTQISNDGPGEMSWSRSKGNIGIAATVGRSSMSGSTSRSSSGRITKKGDEGDSQRKRVKLACRRCRQRKIKCSGPTGRDRRGPCDHCNSNHTDCAFELAGTLADSQAIHFRLRDYGYAAPIGLEGSSATFPSHRSYPVAGNMASHQVNLYPSIIPEFQQEAVQPTYIPYSTGPGYNTYCPTTTVYDVFGQYTTASTQSIPISAGQSVPSSVPGGTPWQTATQHGYIEYSQPTHTNIASTQAILAGQSQIQYPEASHHASLPTESVLPNLTHEHSPYQSQRSSHTCDSDHGSWTSSINSHSEGTSSRRSSNGACSLPSETILPPTSGTALGNHTSNHQSHHTSLGMYPLQPPTQLEKPLPVSIYHNEQQSEYSNQFSDRYGYSIPSQIPSSHHRQVQPQMQPPRSPPLTQSSTIGNNTYTHLPYIRAAPQMPSMQYQVHNGVPKSASCIAIATGRDCN